MGKYLSPGTHKLSITSTVDIIVPEGIFLLIVNTDKLIEQRSSWGIIPIMSKYTLIFHNII